MHALTPEFLSESRELPRLFPGEKVDGKFAAQYPLRILIAEDNYTNRRLLIFLLRGLGYEPDATENGRECLEAVRTGLHDILITDLDMPEMSGLECATQIRQAGIDLSIIAVTASTPEATREECFRAGMNGYLRKPVNVTEIKRILRETSLRKWMNKSNRALLTHGA